MGKALLREYYALCDGGVCQDLLTEEEKKLDKFQGHEHMLDVDEAETYGQYEFLEACQKMGIVRDI